tara:strand:- start:59 stop:574 length:516 start_codon:yes stop_codon:yes gene_type:complete
MSGRFLLSFFLVASFGSAHSADDVIYLAAKESDSLKSMEGQKITVHGKTEGSRKSPSGTNFVNFTGTEFSLVTFKTDLHQFKNGEPSEVYDGMRIAVEGVIAIYQDKPQIKLTSPEQITIIAEGAEFPPPQAPEAKPEEKTTPEPPAKPEEEPKPEEPARKPPVDPSEYFK